MNSWIVTSLLIGIPAALIAFCYFMWRRIRKRSKQKKEIPQDVLETFEEAERRFAESNGTINPHTILWELSKNGRTRGSSGNTSERESRVETKNIPQRPIQRFNFPSINYPVIPRTEPINTERIKSDSGTNRKSFARRLRRKE